MRNRDRGFTLIEILVAIAILAVALAAASRAVGGSIGSAGQLKRMVLADWVAQNQLTQLRVERSWPGVGTYQGKETQAGIEFRWVENVSGTPHPLFRKVEVSVLDPDDDQHVLRRLVGYVARPN